MQLDSVLLVWETKYLEVANDRKNKFRNIFNEVCSYRGVLDGATVLYQAKQNVMLLGY